MWYHLAFFAWSISLCIIPTSFVYDVTDERISFYNWIIFSYYICKRVYSHIYMCIHICVPHFILFHLSVVTHLGRFCTLSIVNNAAINMDVQIAFWADFTSLGYIPRNGIAGPYGNAIFNFLRNCRAVFSQWLHHFYLPVLFWLHQSCLGMMNERRKQLWYCKPRHMQLIWYLLVYQFNPQCCHMVCDVYK